MAEEKHGSLADLMQSYDLFSLIYDYAKPFYSVAKGFSDGLKEADKDGRIHCKVSRRD